MSDKLNENSVNDAENLEETAKVIPEGEELEINAESPKLEENDNWEFEAKAHTLDDTFIENDELVIEIPKKEFKSETRERPKAEPKATPATEQKPKKDNRNITLFLLVGIFCVIAIGALTFLGIRYYTVPATVGATATHEAENPGNIALNINGTKVTAGMYSYYYNQILTSYVTQAQQGAYELDITKDLTKQKYKDEDGKETTWQKKLDDETQKWLQQLVAFYSKGVEEGLTLTADEKKTIDDEINTVKETAKSSGLSLQEYITTTYGDYVTVATLRKSSEWYIIAQNYSRKISMDTPPTVEEAQKYYNEHKDDFLQVKFSWLPMIFTDKNKADVEKQAKKYAAKIKTADDVKKYIPKVCKDLISQYIESGQVADEETIINEIAQSSSVSLTKDNPYQYPDGIVKFLFDDKNKPGTATAVVDDQYSAVYIVLKESNPEPLKDQTYSVRHILITPGSNEEESEEEDEHSAVKEYTEEQWKAAEKQANKVYEEFKKTDKSEYQFALLAEKYSKDPGSVSTSGQGAYGGLYYKQSLGRMVKEFENWAIDKSRKYGDTAIVKTQFGYHIMFFVDAQPDYLMDCKTAVSYDKEEKFIDSYKIKKNEKILNNAIKAINSKVKKDLSANSSAQSAADNTSGDYVTPEEEEAEEEADADIALEDEDSGEATVEGEADADIEAEAETEADGE